MASKLPDTGCDRPVVTSKTFRTLARLAGAAPSGGRPAGAPADPHRPATGTLASSATCPRRQLAEMDGVSPGRAHQLLAGAVVAESAMRHLGHRELDLCPWALREGVILRRLDVPRIGGRRPLCRGLATLACEVPVPVLLSTSSVFPEPTAAAFELAATLGYDGLEIMVWTDAVSQDAGALRGLSEHYGVPVLSVHAPCLLVTQRVWSPDPWERLRRSAELAETLGAPTVVVHPPFAWQRDYARDFAAGLARLREEYPTIRFAIENMYPVRMAGGEFVPYAPGWDPTVAGFDAYTLDLSHCAASRADALVMADRDGRRPRPRAPGRRHRRGPRRAPGPGPRHPAVRRAAGVAGRPRVHRARWRSRCPPAGRPAAPSGRPTWPRRWRSPAHLASTVDA